MSEETSDAQAGGLHNGPPMVAIPGPSILPDSVRAAMAVPMADIYAGDVVDVSTEVLARLPALVGTAGRGFIAVGNGHAGWQMALANTLVAGDRVLVLDSGRFAAFWGAMAAAMGVEVELLSVDDDGPVSAEAVVERLARPDADSFRAVLAVHVDTASSVRSDVQALGAAVREASPDTLLMVDGIAAVGCERYEMDAWGVDLTVGASQKGLMTPPGLALVWAGERALAARQRVEERPLYLDWSPRANATRIYENYGGTPPVSHLYALRAAFELIDKEGGLEAIWRRHTVVADAVRAAVVAWSTQGGLSFQVSQPDARSNAVTTIATGGYDADRIRARCLSLGLTVGLGVLGSPHETFRIGHMGHVNASHILGVIATVEAALRTEGVPVGASGADAAARTIADVLA